MSFDIHLSRSADGIVLTPEDAAALAGLDLTLREWSDAGSFKGVVYIDLVRRVAGMSLGERWIPPADVARMAVAFGAPDPLVIADDSLEWHLPVCADEVRALRRLLRLCADRGIGLVGSW